MTLPRSRSGSRATLRNLGEGDGDSTLKKSRSYDKVYRTNEPLDGKPNVDFPEKKWDLDDEDFMSSDGSEFPATTKAASDIEYINQNDPQRQTGRRGVNLQGANQFASPIEDNEEDDDDDDDNTMPPPPPQAMQSHQLHLQQQQPISPAYSPTFSGLDRNSSGFSGSTQPSYNLRPQPNAVRVLPTLNTNSKFFGEGSMSPTSAGSPTPIGQTVGLPTQQTQSVNAKSTEV